MNITESMGIYSTDVNSITDEIKANAFELLDRVDLDEKINNEYPDEISFIRHGDIEYIAKIEEGLFKCYFCYTEGESEIIDLNERLTDSDPQYKHSQQEGLEILGYYELWKRISDKHFPDYAKGDCDEEAFNYSLMLFMIGVYYKYLEDEKEKLWQKNFSVSNLSESDKQKMLEEADEDISFEDNKESL
ncbi:hypothetical protein [Halomonas sp. AOP35-4E-18]|uniref:hypothetical protein n=1 Tax=Halomonas sp. AOP35-4E-18 TaxID=3457686 RepID=UPI0040333AA5